MRESEKTEAKPLGRARRLRPFFGTFCAVEATGPAALVDHAVARSFDVMADTEHRMHPTRVGSDLVKLIAARHEPVEVGASTWQVLALAKQIWTLSNGVFDPCLPSLPGQLSDVELRAHSTVVCHAPVAIDLGGIAKGFAVDQAIEVLFNEGCSSGIVNAGGDVRVFGPEAHALYLRAPDHEPQQIMLHNAALAVTDVNAANAPSEHRGYYTRSGDRPILRQRAAVSARSAAIADALTKCALFCTSDELDAITRHYSATLLLWQ